MFFEQYNQKKEKRKYTKIKSERKWNNYIVKSKMTLKKRNEKVGEMNFIYD